MRSSYAIHIVAGAIGLASGYVALFSGKGAPLHRRAGTVFVWSMLAMCAAGFLIAVLRDRAPLINVPAALVTASLVATALTTVRPATRLTRIVDRVATAVTLGVGLAMAALLVDTLANGGRPRIFLVPFAMFGTFGLLAAAGDLRLVRQGPPRGSRRIARHLWRMSSALLVAALSFFIGQAKVMPKPLRVGPLLALPVLLVLVTLVYWLWRVRGRHALRGMVVARESRPDGPGEARGPARAPGRHGPPRMTGAFEGRDG